VAEESVVVPQSENVASLPSGQTAPWILGFEPTHKSGDTGATLLGGSAAVKQQLPTLLSEEISDALLDSSLAAPEVRTSADTSSLIRHDALTVPHFDSWSHRYHDLQALANHAAPAQMEGGQLRDSAHDIESLQTLLAIHQQLQSMASMDL
jgi:hypothetical protein